MLKKIIFFILTFLFSCNLYAMDISKDYGIKFDISKAIDSFPIIISVMGYMVVFLSLVTLIIFVLSMTRFLSNKQRKRLQKEKRECADVEDLNIPGDVNAAIALALHLHFNEIHDDEEAVLTILKHQKSYKPWSSKLYSMTQTPQRIQNNPIKLNRK